MSLIGKKAENFTLFDQEGNEFNLFENLDKKVMLIFYPMDDSPVCSRQLKNYSKHLEKFIEHGIKPVGVNPAPQESHKDFYKKFSADIKLLSDRDKKIAERFDALNFMGTTKRKLVLINEEKEIVWEDENFAMFYTGAKKVIDKLKSADLLK